MKTVFQWFAIAAWCAILHGGTTGSISGTITDATQGVIAGAKVTAINIAQGVQFKTVADTKGLFTFPALPVGQYKLEIEAQGFKSKERTGITVDLDSTQQIDLTLEVAEKVDTVTVAENAVTVETASTQVGEVMTSRAMTAVALNGRSFTDLLALQPGIVPTSTQQPDSIVMAGVTVAIAPSG